MIWKLLKEVERYERLVRLAMPMSGYIESGLEKLISDGELYSEDFDFGQDKML